MFMVGPYLFSGDTLESYLADQRAAAVAALKERVPAGASPAKRDAAVREVFERFLIPVTNMQVEGAHFTDERPLTDEERAAIGVAPEDGAPYKAISIAIPYSGDAHLFTCTPAIYSAHQPQAEVKDGELHVTYFLSEIEEFQLENNFKRQIALIDRTLEVTQWQAMAYNEQLMDVLSGALAGA